MTAAPRTEDRSRFARRDSADVLHRMTVVHGPRPAILTEEQALAGQILRTWVAEAQGGLPTIWDAILGDRVDMSHGTPLWPLGGAGNPQAKIILFRLQRSLSAIDLAICDAVALRQCDIGEVMALLRPLNFVTCRRETVSHIRRAFEALRIFFDGA